VGIDRSVAPGLRDEAGRRPGACQQRAAAPRGAAAPLGYIPPPAPARASETVDENERRFPILEHQQRKEREERAKMQAAGRVEVRPSDPTQACEGLTPEEKVECPLRDPKAVLSITDLPKGVRVSLRPNTVAPEKLQQEFACHKSLAVARPQAPTACAFFDARAEGRGGRPRWPHRRGTSSATPTSIGCASRCARR
jgi:hypothetical protein